MFSYHRLLHGDNTNNLWPSLSCDISQGPVCCTKPPGGRRKATHFRRKDPGLSRVRIKLKVRCPQPQEHTGTGSRLCLCVGAGTDNQQAVHVTDISKHVTAQNTFKLYYSTDLTHIVSLQINLKPSYFHVLFVPFV